MPSTLRAALDEGRCLRGVFNAPTVETLVRSIDAGRSAAAPIHDLDSILNARLGLGDAWVRWVSGAWNDRSRG